MDMRVDVPASPWPQQWDLNNGLSISVSSIEQPTDSQTTVLVQDTYGIMKSPGGTVKLDPRDFREPAKTKAKAASFEPALQGRVRFKRTRGRPNGVIEVVLYDFDLDPPVDLKTIDQTLGRVLELAEAEAVAVLALPHDFGLEHSGILVDDWYRSLCSGLKERPRHTRTMEVTLLIEPAQKGALCAQLGPLLMTRH